MNEKRKSEGEIILSVFSDDRSRAQKLLERCKEDERKKKKEIIRLGKGTWYFLPAGTDIEKWKDDKQKNLGRISQ